MRGFVLGLIALFIVAATPVAVAQQLPDLPGQNEADAPELPEDRAPVVRQSPDLQASQEPDNEPLPDNAPPADEEAQENEASRRDLNRLFGGPRSDFEYYLTALTVVIGIIFAGLFSVMHARTRAGGDDFARVFVLIVVIFSALFLIVAGYSERQTAPVFGLLGTIVGYIFGRAANTPPGPPAAGGQPPGPAPAAGGLPEVAVAPPKKGV